MADENPSNSIPDGWFWNNKLSKYECQATGQQFSAYEALMRYVNYAKADEVSMYSRKFDAAKLEKSGSKSAKLSGCRSSKKRVSGQSSKSANISGCRSSKKRVSGQSSRSAVVGKCSRFAALDQSNESTDLEGKADLGEPAEDPNEKGSLPHQAGLEKSKQVQVPDLQIADGQGSRGRKKNQKRE